MHLSPLTSHLYSPLCTSHLTSHTPHLSPLTPHFSPLTSHPPSPPPPPHHPPPPPHPSPLTPHFSPLTSHLSPLTWVRFGSRTGACAVQRDSSARRPARRSGGDWAGAGPGRLEADV